jgi:hypothetical protein
MPMLDAKYRIKHNDLTTYFYGTWLPTRKNNLMRLVVVALLNQSPVFEWHMARLVVQHVY